jgi:hypothetical protein
VGAAYLLIYARNQLLLASNSNLLFLYLHSSLVFAPIDLETGFVFTGYLRGFVNGRSLHVGGDDSPMPITLLAEEPEICSTRGPASRLPPVHDNSSYLLVAIGGTQFRHPSLSIFTAKPFLFGGSFPFFAAPLFEPYSFDP